MPKYTVFLPEYAIGRYEVEALDPIQAARLAVEMPYAYWDEGKLTFQGWNPTDPIRVEDDNGTEWELWDEVKR